MQRLVFALALAGLVFLGTPAVRSGDDDSPIIKAAKENLRDTKKPFTMVVVVTVKEGTSKQFEEIFRPAIAPTRKEAGCIAYDLNRDLKEDTKFYIYERWRSLAALQSHLETPHIKTLLSKMGEVVAGQPDLKFFAIASE